MAEQSSEPATGLEIAVVGMAGRFPGADDLQAFWSNLRAGVESISFYRREELLEAGTDPALLDDPRFVPARGELRAADELDAALFGLTRRDAEILDPQHRVLLECAWAALEHAGCDPARLRRPVGVFAGTGTNRYGVHLEGIPELVGAVGQFRITMANEKDHVAAGIAYRLDLRGPAMAVQTACSTSLVAVHVACQSLINGECDLALAGGACVGVPPRRGYLYAPDGILSPDGHCRAFDADARGTVSGNGAGMVALKRLDDALAEGDTIHAVIRGSAVNNDGAQKVGYTAPSITGQARVISEALSVARVEASTLGYVETHGSGTPLGDAIELKALGQVLAGGGEPCAIGSVKTNVGHLDAAAGVAGLIKTVLALENGEIPPSLHCATPHPEIGASGGRVFVNTGLRPWARNGTPRRAGVSSFGIGGTNAHVVLEEAPPRASSGPSRALQLLVLSAKTPSALARAAGELADHLESGATPLADAAYTLQTGRRELEHRLAVVCADAAEGAARLREAAARAAAPVPRTDRPVAFLFPGLGMQHVDMARGLYDAEPVFRAAVDECCDRLLPVLGSDLRAALYAADPAPAAGGWDLRRMLGRAEGGTGASPLDDTRLAQPAVFVTEYALAKLWMSWGVRPCGLLGHSLGEYVAACVSGVLRLEDALTLVALRAKLIDALPAGAMLAVPLGEAALREILPAGLDLAAVNTAESCVVSGPAEEIARFEALLAERGTVHRRLAARHAFHSRAMEPVAAELERLVARFDLSAPAIPFVSNVTGTWIGDDEARSPAYWARHLCGTVRFADGVATLRGEAGWALLEVGPGQTLGAWALQHPAEGGPGGHAVLSSLRHPHNRVPDLRFLLETLGGLWAAGVEVDWAAFGAGERRHRVPLPGYPFERTRYWVDAPRAPAPPHPAKNRIAALEPAGHASAPESNPEGPDTMDKGLEHRGTAPSPRYTAVLGRLRGIAAELTGIEERQVGTDTDFFQAGFDSLLLLQAIQVVEKRMGVRLSLVEMLEEMTTLEAVARHIDAVLPADARVEDAAPLPEPALAVAEASVGASAGTWTPAPPPAVAAVAAPPAFYPSVPPFAPAYPAPPVHLADPVSPAIVPGGSGGEGALERVIAQQLQLVVQQNAQQAQQNAQQLQLLAQQIAALHHAAPSAHPAHGNGAHASNGNGSHPSDGNGSANGNGSVAHASHGSGSGAPGANGNGVHASNGTGTHAVPAVVPRAVPQSPRARIQPETFVPYQPVSTEGTGGMTAAQRAYLDDFIARYVRRTPACKAHQARYHLPLADTRVTARFRRAWKEILYPIVSSRAQGARVWDLDGNEYVDTGMAFGCALFGHAPEFVSRAIREQVELGYGVGPQSPLAGRAAELVCELGGNDRAVFCNSGTEAVMGAIRAARTFTGRSRIAYFAGSYHGWSDAVLGRLVTAGGRREVRPLGPGISALPLDDVLMLEYDEPASLELLAQHLDEIALVMVEPVQSRRPDLQPTAFVRELRRMTRESGALLLFDELITGFRVGAGGAQAFFGVDADLVTYGKIVAGGLPMGVVAGRREVMDVFDGGVWSYGDDSYPPAQRTIFAGAYFKHPLSMAVACSILEEIRRQGAPMYEALNARTTRLVERINAFFEAGGYPITAAHFSSCFRFFFGPEVRFPDLFSHHLILEGIHVIPETGTHFISTAHTDEDLEKIFQAIRASAEALRRGGFIPGGPAGTTSVSTSGARGATPAAALPAPASAGGAGPTSVAVSAGEPRAVPLTEGQRQLWIESQMGDDACCAYIESSSVRLGGALDVGALRVAVQALVDRHDTLRMSFGRDGDVQLIHPALTVEVPLTDFRAAPAEARDAQVRAWLRDTVQRPFDLVNGPLVRFALAALADDEHLLVFDAHHAALDGWSFGVVLQELGVLYAAARDGRPAELAPRPDHAALVRAQVEAEDPAAQAFWMEQFADGVPVLELPTDRPRAPVRSYRGGRIERELGGLLPALAAASRAHGLTLFNTLLSSVFVWLGRLSGEDDVVVGTPAAGQARSAAAAELVGYGINLMPVRARLDADASFVEQARRVRRTVVGGVQNQNFSFPKLVEKLLRSRDPSRPPVFSVLMNLDRAPEASLLGDLRAEYRSNFGGGAKVDLTLDMTEAGDDLHVRCVYAADLYDRETVERWLDAFACLLRHVARDPGARISELELMGEAERGVVVREWNRTAHPYPHLCIHELFEAQARRTPHAVAVEAEGETLTYAELDARANQLAHHLRRRGVGVEDRVALCLERRPELMAAFFGVLKAGAAYVPLDPTHPADRLAYMLQDSGARLLLTQSWLQGRLPAQRPEALCLDERAAEIAAEPAERPESGVRPENLAYVYYTSGSTGRPKGVAMHHYGPSNYFAWGSEAYGAGEGRGAPVFSSMAVDLTLASFIPLFCGERVVLVPEGPGVEPLAEAIRQSPGFAMIKITPTHLSLLNQVLTPAEAAASTATLVIGADSLAGETTRFWQAGAPGVRLLNEYGPTETVVGCSLYALPAGRRPEGRVPIGRPIHNLTMYVLDARMHPVPAGVPGELYVGGVGVARGYLGRPALTAEKFVPDPFAAAPGARLYRTGDRARFLGDGNLDFLGRVDFQVKIRGYRIETGEVESVLAAHPGVRHARVLAREDVPGDRRLVAYVVAEGGAPATPEALRQALRERLPEYMVPAAFVFMDALPVGSTGKLSPASFPAPEYAGPGEGYVAPRTPTEAALAEVWAEVLQRERVGAEENFFELGGHSLLAMRVVSRVRQRFAVELPLRAVFENATLAGLAARVDALRGASPGRLAPVVPVPRSGPLPLSFAQERLWFLDRLQPGTDFYSIPVARRLTGALDAGALERALGEIVRRHESLRTVFVEAGDAPVQVIAPFAGFALPVEDLSGLEEAEREAQARRRAAEHAAAPFDLAAGPLFRARLLRLGAEEHVLLLNLHHVVADGWSIGVLFRELAALYAACRDGAASPLAELAVQYADYAVWQREQLSGETLDRQLAYWRGELAGAPALLELPADHPRPPVQSYRGGWVPVEVPAALLERLQALGRREDATLYMILLAAFQVLLGKYAGTDDVVVGSAIAGRTQAEVEPLIGFFVNTLVLRTDLGGDPDFREVLRRVRASTLGAYEHQDLPFERLVEALQPERSLSHSPLFQVMFSLDDAPGVDGLPGVRMESVGTDTESVKFDLTLNLAAPPGALYGALLYSTDLFERETAARMVRHLERVLEQVAADAELPISRIALAGAEERARVVEEWNRTDRDFPRDACVHALFQAQVERTPGALALAWGDERLSYRELDARANRLAHLLVAMGVGPEARVGILLERSLEQVVATLAVLKAGGCCVAVDTSYPAERMALMLADGGARVVVSRGTLAEGLAESGVRVVRLDAAAERLAAAPDAAPATFAAPENLAYVFYTSGSTGRPKGVMMAHREVVQLAMGLPACMPLGPGDRVAQASNASFDAAVFEIWGALLHGAALVGIDRDVLLSAPALGRALREGGITHLYQTAALFNQHVREQVDVYASLKQLVFGAEAVGTESVRRMLRAGRPGRVLHEYGPTEATVWCTLHPVHEVADDAATVSIGRPIPNARMYVLDGAGQPLPAGVPGELCVGGAGVVRGYLGLPGLSAAKFVPDPFSARPGARMYRTGDRVRWKGDGTLEFMGRLDDQVKIRGFRIEPGEVQTAVAAYPGVRHARVVVREDRPGDKRLVAYVVGEVDLEALRAHLRRGLPEYMVPGALVPLERLPLTPNGKLDRAALPAPGYGTDARYAAPRTPAEEVLAGIWCGVLGHDRVSVTDSFFALGGHSLLATRVASRVRAVFGVELPIRTFFEGPTVAELAEAVEALRAAGAPQALPVLPVRREGPLPLSFAQERLWFLERLQQGGTAHNVTRALRLSGGVDEAALERALAEVVRRHEPLRTTFREANGVPAQVIAPFDGFTLPVEDLSGLGAAAREAGARRRAEEDAARPFDLVAGPLFRAALLRLAADEHVLLLGMHHIVVDGWSMRVLFRELWTLYEAFREGRDAALPALAVQYADYAVWQREQAGGEGEARQLAYWRAQLAGAPELLELPSDRPRPPVPSFRGAWVNVEVPAGVLGGLQALARAEGATLYMVALAAFQALLARYAGSDDVVVGTLIAGRTRQEVEELVGLFMNTLVLRTDLSGDPRFREALGRVRQVTLGAYEHQALPFERVVAELQPERSLSHSTLFQVMFQLNNADERDAAPGGLRVSGVEAERDTTKFDLTLVLDAHEDGLRGVLEYSADLFDRATAARMAAHLERVLEQVAADPDTRLSRLELMDAAERARVAEWNRTEAEYASTLCIHQLFEAQAARTPDAPAVLCGDQSLTYRALDEAANRLAGRLARLGVGPEVRVGLCMERSPELMVAILGVMKAGGAYVPMDPGHPADRLAYVLDDSAVPVLLTQERLRERIPAGGRVQVVCVDGYESAEADGAAPPASAVTSENLAYVIYTSGSTGRPKGVAMHHRGVVNYLEWGIRHYGADAGTGAPVFTSMAVDLTITNLLPLFAGHPVRMLPEENAVEALAEVLRQRPGFGLIKITPIHLGLLNAMLSPDEAAGAAHTLVVGADFLSAEPTVFWQEHAPGVRLMNEYGPTETVVGCSAYTLPNGVHRAGPVPVGGPIQNLTFHVLDAHGQPVPVGLPGELYIGGAGVARGYLGRPGLSAEKFVPDPFAGAGARMYRTGDRARWLEGGNLMILGRTDNQVKIRGYRVELGEVEAALRRVPGVREVMVAAREDMPGNRRLVAWVVGRVEAETLRLSLRATLPEYMVPAAFVMLDAFPQTPTGKLDRKALPPPVYGGGEEAEFDEPRNYEEAQLIQLWEEVLEVDGIGATRDFFELGGNSFLALRLFAQVNRRLHCDLPVATLFAGATVRHMADAIREQKRAAAAPTASVVPLQPNGSLPPVFVIHSTDRSVMGYVNLVRHLGPEQPVYGLRDVGDDLSRPLERIAAEHLAALRTVQPRGPYYLVGWSFGGFLAYEMALQLERQGETAAFVGLMDTMSTALAEKWPWMSDADIVTAIAEEAAARRRRPFRFDAKQLEGVDRDEQVRRVSEALHAQQAVGEDYTAAVLAAQCQEIRDRAKSYAGYVPGGYAGTLTLFRAEEWSPRHEVYFAPLDEEEKRTLGWSRHALGAVEVHPVPGSHVTIGAEPHVRRLAESMTEALAAARERAGAPAGARP